MDEGVEWWRQVIFPRTSIPVADLIGSLLQCQNIVLPQMPPKMIAVYLTMCLEGKAVIELKEWERFLVRFGPFRISVSKAVQCFQERDAIAPWFHGLITRAEAEAALHQTDDGTFLVRFSETQPDKFSLSYMKVHTDPLYMGKREIKNVLIIHKPEVRMPRML